MHTLADWLQQKYPTAKRQSLKRMVESRRVLINGIPATRLSQTVPDGAKIFVAPRAPAETSRSANRPVASSPYEIIFEDHDLLIVNKPPGLLTSTVPREKRPTLLSLLKNDLAHRDPAARLGLIHRLDRDASGLLVFSKNNQAYESLKRQFFTHSVTRIYTAIVHGHPNPTCARITTRLVESPDGSVHSTPIPHRGELAISHYDTIRQLKDTTLLKIKLETGRKHQIRVHLSQRGHPIVGDPVYARPPAKPAKPKQAGGTGEAGGKAGGSEVMRLCATQLSLDHPRTGERRIFTIEPPWLLK